MEEARTGLAKNGVVFIRVTTYRRAEQCTHLSLSQLNVVVYLSHLFLRMVCQCGLIDIQKLKLRSCVVTMKTLRVKDCANRRRLKDILFDRETLDNMVAKEPLKEVAGFKIFKNYDPSHRYGSGHDVAGGVGLDSSTSVFIDFETVPAQVVGTFANNTIKPEVFGDEVSREANFFPGVVAGVEKQSRSYHDCSRPTAWSQSTENTWKRH